MSDTSTTAVSKRTAVLMVHGIGNQRPLDTVRGLVDAVWRDLEEDDKEGDTVAKGTIAKDPKYVKKTWVHPEASGIDLDLSVITTNAVPEVGDRNVDFHELYWAHLMSETRAIAVVLWLFELVRKGPLLNPRMKLLWWGSAIFLSALILSISYLIILGIVWFSNVGGEPQSVFYATVLMLLLGCAGTIWYSWRKRAFQYVKIVLPATLFVSILVGCAYGMIPPAWQAWAANQVLPLTVAVVTILVVMGTWGFLAFLLTFGFSILFFLVYLAGLCIKYWFLYFATSHAEGVSMSALILPWNLQSSWSAVAAWIIIGFYLIANAAFLQSYLGDAARYFRNSPANVAGRREIRRQAVDTLEALHNSGLYDRIVVVAHSLGTVVAYDMMRAYYARICRQIPIPKDPEPLARLEAADKRDGDPAKRRELGRAVIRDLAKAVPGPEPAHANRWTQPKAWLVTDFVTLGSALVHARYLMCRGDTSDELDRDFFLRKKERELPICPPYELYDDGLLTFTPPGSHRRFHHGGMFALTRWTNLYFDMSEILWGDPVGGPLRPIFGAGIHDIKVYSDRLEEYDWLAHTKYWDIKCRPKNQEAPHIVALRQAISLQKDDGVVTIPQDPKS